jgi:GNAT superfamily N-acetyltransferase
MMGVFEQRRRDYVVSDDPSRLDHDAIYAFLSKSYWAANRARHTQDMANRYSLCFGLYHADAQVGFGRVVTDHATFAYLADVYVLEAHRGQGLGRWLMECVHAHPRLQGLRRWALATRDAHGLYEQFGWVPLTNAERWMERFDASANPPHPLAG